MKLSILIPIFNRSKLFEIGLKSLVDQTMPKKDWEIVLVDDMSTEDLSKVYSKYPINIQHIKIDPRKHPHYRGYHTQSLALNIAIKKARGDVICITQPEVIHDCDNLARGYDQALQGDQVFGKIVLSNRHFTDYIFEHKTEDFEKLWQKANENPFYAMADNELYWYILFVRKEPVELISGVDESYMEGVYAEDDNFKERLRIMGATPTLNRGIRGIHINHEFEADLYPKQDRTTDFWNKGAERNRARFDAWQKDEFKSARANDDNWGSIEYIIETKGMDNATDIC